MGHREPVPPTWNASSPGGITTKESIGIGRAAGDIVDSVGSGLSIVADRPGVEQEEIAVRFLSPNELRISGVW